MGDISTIKVFGNELLAIGNNNTLAYSTGNNLWIAGNNGSANPSNNNDKTWTKLVINSHIYGLDNVPVFWLISVNNSLILWSYAMWYSPNNGINWFQCLDIVTDTYNMVAYVAKAANNGKDIVYAGSRGLQRSLNSGASWTLCNILRPAAGSFVPIVQGFTYNKDTHEYIITITSNVIGSPSLELSSPIFKSTDGINFENFGSGSGLTAHNDNYGYPAGKYTGSIIYDNSIYIMLAPDEPAILGDTVLNRVWYTSLDLNLWTRHISSSITINGNTASTPNYTDIGMLAGPLYPLSYTDNEAAITDNYIMSSKVNGIGFSTIINSIYVVPEIMRDLEHSVYNDFIIDYIIQTVNKANNYYWWAEYHYEAGFVVNSTLYASPELDILYNNAIYRTTSDVSIIEVKTEHLGELYFIEKIPNSSGAYYHTLSKMVLL